jgi:hypothetical protein
MDQDLMNLEEDFHRVVPGVIHILVGLLLDMMIEDHPRRGMIEARHHPDIVEVHPIIFELLPSADLLRHHAPEIAGVFLFDPTKKSEIGLWSGDESVWRDQPSLISLRHLNS